MVETAVTLAIPLLAFVAGLFIRQMHWESDSEFAPKFFPFKMAVSFIVLFVSVLGIFLVAYFARAFPIYNIDDVVFTLLSENSGSENFVLNMIWEDGLPIRTIIALCAVFAVEIFIAQILAKMKKRHLVFSAGKFRKNIFTIGCFKDAFLGTSGIFAAISFFAFWIFLFIRIPIADYAEALSRIYSDPVDSPLYRNFYVFPDSV